MVPRPDPSSAGRIDHRDCSVAVQLSLEYPIGGVERLLYAQKLRHVSQPNQEPPIWIIFEVIPGCLDKAKHLSEAMK
jgi:hypothetical protein